MHASGRHDRAPRHDEDGPYRGDGHVIPGAHPLPSARGNDNSLTHPHASPYLPSPSRTHPYWTSPPPELPHFGCSVPIVYPWRTLKERIVAPVVSTSTQRVTHSRELDPYLFGMYPHTSLMEVNSTYWRVRCQDYRAYWDFQKREIWKKAKKAWANTGTGLPRTGNRRVSNYRDGGRAHPMKPWNLKMPSMHPEVWHTTNRMALTLKMLQGRVQIVDRLELSSPTVAAFVRLCNAMRWDTRHKGAGVLFIDGGSRLAPSLEFHRNFFYGSFHAGRVSVKRPTLTCDDSVDWNWTATKANTRGPKGAKNPIPLNRFNCYDAMSHNLVVVTEGALALMECEMLPVKVAHLPPHIRQQLAADGALDSAVLGDTRFPVDAVEREAAARTEEHEADMFAPFYDSPYAPWADEGDASYAVDAVDGVVRRDVDGNEGVHAGSWKMLE